MTQQDDLSSTLNDLSLSSKTKTVKPKASYDKAALRERWNILGKDAEQGKLKNINEILRHTMRLTPFFLQLSYQ